MTVVCAYLVRERDGGVDGDQAPDLANGRVLTYIRLRDSVQGRRCTQHSTIRHKALTQQKQVEQTLATCVAYCTPAVGGPQHGTPAAVTHNGAATASVTTTARSREEVESAIVYDVCVWVVVVV